MPSKSGFLTGIEKLRNGVDFSPYQPTCEVPRWLGHLAKFVREDLGSLAILGPSGVSISSGDGHRVRVIPDALGLYIVAISDKVRGTGQKVAVGIPPTARHLPLLLASAAVLAATLEHSRGSTRSGNILVISRDLDIRSRYCDVYVHKQSLDDAHPGSRMRQDGTVAYLRSEAHGSRGAGGVCFFLPDINLPRHTELVPSLIILDLRYARWSKRAKSLAAWTTAALPKAGVLSLYTVGDSESAAALSQAGFTDIPFDHTAISTSAQKVSQNQVPLVAGVDFSLSDAPQYLARNHSIEEISGGDALEHLYSSIAKVLYDQTKSDNVDLNRAKWLLAVLSTVPVPLHWFEVTARGLGRSTLKRLTELLGSRSKQEKGIGPIVQSARMLLQQFYNAIEIGNPRAEAIKHLIQTVAVENEDQSLLILVRDRTAQQALEGWLALEAYPNATWLVRVVVRSYDTYSEISKRQYHTVIINGAVPRRYRWILGAALGTRVIFLAYAHESEVVEHQLRAVYDDEGRQARSRTRDKSVAVLLGTPFEQMADPFRAESAIPQLSLQMKVRRNREEVKIAGGLSGIAKALEAAREAAIEATISAASCEQDLGEEDLPGGNELDMQEPLLGEGFNCLSFNVVSSRHGPGRIWLDIDDFVECVRPTEGEDVLWLQGRGLKVGDILLRTESSDARGSFFDQMVQLAEGQPEMEYLASFRKAWREAIQTIAAQNRSIGGLNYGKVFEALKSAGAPIASEQTVRLWMNDQVIGPEAVESIEAVGRISGSTALVSQSKKFDRAFRQIRGVHQGIGRRLSTAIRNSFHHLEFGESKHPAVKLDDRLNIPLDELLETVDMAEIRSISTTTEKKPPQIVGRFTPRE